MSVRCHHPQPRSHHLNPDPPKTPPQCRSLTVEGPALQKRCPSTTPNLCYSHARHRHPTLPHPAQVAVPLLEDHAPSRLVSPPRSSTDSSPTTLKPRSRPHRPLRPPDRRAAALPRHRPPPPAEPDPNPSSTQVHSLALDEDRPHRRRRRPSPAPQWRTGVPRLPVPGPLALLAAPPTLPARSPSRPPIPSPTATAPSAASCFYPRRRPPSSIPTSSPSTTRAASSATPTAADPNPEVHCPGCAESRNLWTLPAANAIPNPTAETAASLRARDTAPAISSPARRTPAR